MTLTWEIVQAYRQQTFRLNSDIRVRTKEQAVQFVQERGYVFFWPIRGFVLPSLWSAVAGDRPVADAHDDPGHITWDWKDSLLGSRSWYYAKVLRRKATMISMEFAPYFYALSENYGSPEEDFLTIYEQGRMTQEAKAIYEAILVRGPLDTVALRKITHLTSRTAESRFNQAVAALQADFKIVPVGTTQSGAWHYAFAYDLVPRCYPELPDKAQQISEREARFELLRLMFNSLGAAPVLDVKKLFGWRLPAVEYTINELVENGLILRGLSVDKHPGEWAALCEMLK